MFGRVLQEIETKKLEEAKGRVGRREKVKRYLFTRLGLIRFERHKVKYKEKGKKGKGGIHERFLIGSIKAFLGYKLDDLFYLSEN